jgi:hypothetical protein
MVEYELLSNLDIEELCREFKIPLVACVSKDMLARLSVKNGGYVINLDNSGSAGTHWVALYIENSDACYWDSFGMIPPLEVLKFCKNKHLIHNRDQIQNLNQEACGYYCIAFLHFMNKSKKGMNIRTKLYMFNKPYDIDNTTKNDDILQVYLRCIKK